MSKTKFVLGISLVLVFGHACSCEKKEASSKAEAHSLESQGVEQLLGVKKEELVGTAKDYQIVEAEDTSVKALGRRALSSYTNKALQDLPLAKRRVYRIVVPRVEAPSELKATLAKVVDDQVKKDPDIDGITVFAYRRKADVGGAYTLGKLEWCPNGRFQDIDKNIAATNDRSSYRYVFDIRDSVKKGAEKPSARDFEIHDALNKALDEKPNHSEERVKKRVAKRFGISTDEVDKAFLKVFVYNSN